MKNMSLVLWIFIAVIAIAAGMIVYAKKELRPEIAGPDAPNTTSSTMKLTSPAFNDQGPIPSLYTCDGKNISPPLLISGVPKEAKSLVLLLEDPDAPVGIFDHWLVFNIDPKLTEIPEDTEPQGTAGKGSANNLTYMGPCPPSGVHRYLFTVYALDTKLGLSQGSAKIDVVNAMNGHVLEQAQLVGTYEREK